MKITGARIHIPALVAVLLAGLSTVATADSLDSQSQPALRDLAGAQRTATGFLHGLEKSAGPQPEDGVPHHHPSAHHEPPWPVGGVAAHPPTFRFMKRTSPTIGLRSTTSSRCGRSRAATAQSLARARASAAVSTTTASSCRWLTSCGSRSVSPTPLRDPWAITAHCSIPGTTVPGGIAPTPTGLTTPFTVSDETSYGSPRGQVHFWLPRVNPERTAYVIPVQPASQQVWRRGVEGMTDPYMVEMDQDYNSSTTQTPCATTFSAHYISNQGNSGPEPDQHQLGADGVPRSASASPSGSQLSRLFHG